MITVGNRKDDDEARLSSVKHEIWGVALLAIALLTIMALYLPGMGSFGWWVARGLMLTLGDAAIALPIAMGLLGTSILFTRSGLFLTGRNAGLFTGFLIVVAFLHISVPQESLFDYARLGAGGGYLGAALNWGLLYVFGLTGRIVVLSALAVVALMLSTDLSIVAVLLFTRGIILRILRGIGGVLAELRFLLIARPGASAQRETRKSASDLASEVLSRRPEDYHRGGNSGPDGGNGSKESSNDQGPDDRVILARQIKFGPSVFYQVPKVNDVFNQAKGRPTVSSDRDIQQMKEHLEQSLASFEVEAEVVDIVSGPRVTRFEIQPGPGVKVKHITTLADDLALSLAASGGVRIEAPIPGKRAIGLEVPNNRISYVAISEVVGSPQFKRHPSCLRVGWGLDIAGRPVVHSLDEMVHVLVAGATGSGKSSCINAIITSLLSNTRPDEVKFLLIDPKRVELNVYDGIPHLLGPVITDPRKAAACLQWVAGEMDSRYEMFSDLQVRDIAAYNELIAEGRDGEQGNRGTGTEKEPPKPLPFIIVVIDELADLMMVAPGEVEDAILRLSSMARAAGIYLVVATQRPSVDVVTGTIKSNIPSRIAFAVSSQTDSRVILDVNGAEKLLGKGDMLFSPVGANKPRRVQCSFVTSSEIRRLVAFVKKQAAPEFDEGILELKATANGIQGGDEEDELFEEAVRIVVEAGEASISMLQRKLRVGHARAGRLIDTMAEKGIVGPHQGPKPREVMMDRAAYGRVYGEGGGTRKQMAATKQPPAEVGTAKGDRGDDDGEGN